VEDAELVENGAYVADRRVKVKMVAGMYIHAGASIEQIMAQYALTAAEVHSALAYYYDHQDQFEAADRELEPLVEQARKASAATLEALRARKIK
jgi:uncharacterized protein (DUF433 family)